MLAVVTIRRETEKYSHGHIVTAGANRAVCGVGVPNWIDPSNPADPYVNKAAATCPDCVSRFHNWQAHGSFLYPDELSAMQEGSE